MQNTTETLAFVFQEPLGFKDWNDQLREKQQILSFPTAHASSLDVA